MATVNQEKFVNFLKSLNVDLNQFRDLSFDNICEEPSLQPFLSWLFTSFDCDNVLSDDEADIPPLVKDEIDEVFNNQEREHLENNNDLEMYQALLASLETRLDKSEQLLYDTRLFEEQLCQKEKQHHENYKSSESINNDNTSNVLDEIENTLQVCLNTQLFVPNIVDFNEESENLPAALQNFYTHSVVNIKQSIDIEQKNLNPDVDNLEQAVFDSVMEEERSLICLRSALAWLENGANVDEWHAVENINREDIKQNALITVRGKLRSREISYLQRKIGVNNYLHSALTLNRDLMLENHLLLIINQSLIEKRLASGANHEANVHLFEKFLNEIESNIRKSLDISDTKKQSLQVVIKSSCHDEIPKYDALLSRLRKECERNKPFRTEIENFLTSLRIGPTLRFNIVPMKLQLMLNDCQSLRKRLEKTMRQLVGFYFGRREVKNLEREMEMDLLWVTFLNDHSNL